MKITNNKRHRDKDSTKFGTLSGKTKSYTSTLTSTRSVGRELERLIKSGNLEKINNVDEDCFVSPVVITVKSDKSVKIALDSRKLNDSSVKMRPHTPNMEELLIQISTEITRDRTTQLFISKLDLDYAYGHINLSEETSRQCVMAITGGSFNGYYRFKKGFYGLPDIPKIFQKNRSNT